MVDSNLPRRRVLKAASAAGLGTFGLSTPALGSESDDTVEIVKVRTEDKYPNKTKEVPGEWYRQIQNSRRVANELKNKHGDKGWFKEISRTNGDETIDGKYVAELSVSTTNPSKAHNELPDEANGVAVGVREWSEPDPDCDHVNFCDTTKYTDCLPGGAWVRPELSDGSLSCHSWTCQVQHAGESRLLTCSHGFRGSSCSEDITGRKLCHHGTVIGHVQEYDHAMDFAIVDNKSDLNLSDSVTGEGNSIAGTYTRDGLDDLKSNGDTVYHYGVRTCRTSGVIDHIYPHWGGPCGNANEVAIRSTAATDGGDSGGIHYGVESILGLGRTLSVIAPHYGRDSEGVAAYRIEDKYDVSFSPSSYC